MTLAIVPADEASWEDIDAVFGTRGDPSRCRCQDPRAGKLPDGDHERDYEKGSAG